LSSTGWKQALVPGAHDGSPTAGYEQIGNIVGRPELMAAAGQRTWWEGEFSGRAQVPHTTSAAEAVIRRRQLERLTDSTGFERSRPLLELGCADGLVTHHLLALGFERVVSTDIEFASVVKLDRSLEDADRDKVMLIVDDMLRLPFADSSFDVVIAWGVLSVSGDFDRALERAWGWVAPGGRLLLAEPILESVLVYTLVRGDLDEFRRTLAEGTRAAAWDAREERYCVNRLGFYRDRLRALPDAAIAVEGGVNMLPSLVLGGIAQDSPPGETRLAELTELLTDSDLDDLALWRQAFWVVEKG
jgi:SAM-dependent methyltransferase